MRMVESALNYFKRGWCVIPLHNPVSGGCSCRKQNCKNPGKHPRLPWSNFQSERPDEDRIHSWWQKWPKANIGIVTGAISGIVVLDVDGDVGRGSLKSHHLPLTPVVVTGKGCHYYFSHPGGTVPNGVKVLPGVDVRGDGGLVVAPPSLHASGRRYQWAPGLSPDETDLAPCPDWLLELLRPKKQGLARPVEDWRNLVRHGVKEGERNNTIASLAGHLLRHYVDPYVTLELLLAWNEARCFPPLPEKEIIATVNSVAKLEAKRRLKTGGGSSGR